MFDLVIYGTFPCLFCANVDKPISMMAIIDKIFLIIENLFLVYYNIKTTENQNPIPLYTKKSLRYPFGRQREYN